MTRSLYGVTETGQKIHVLQATGYYLAQVRRMGYRRYETVGKAKTLEGAIVKAGKAMKGRHRLRVIFCDHNPYYGPNLCFEGIRK